MYLQLQVYGVVNRNTFLKREKIFYLADGFAYLDGLAEETRQEEWKQFISSLYTDILSGKYIKSDRRYDIPLTKVA